MVDRERYRDLFVQEAREHLQTLSEGLQTLADQMDREVLDALFRAAHSFKGMAATLAYQQESDLAHEMEDHLSDARDDGALPGPVRQALVRAVDRLQVAVDRVEAAEEPDDLGDMTAALRDLQPETETSQAERLDPAALADHLEKVPEKRRRIIHLRLAEGCAAPRARLLLVTRTLRQEGELVAALPPEGQWSDLRPGDPIILLLDSTTEPGTLDRKLEHTPDLAEHSVQTALPRPAPEATAPGPVTPAPPRVVGRTVRIDVDQVDRLLDQASELRIAYSQLDRQLDDLFVGPRPYPLTEALERLSREAKAIHDAALEMRTLPVRLVTDRLPRLVRELSDRLGKTVELHLENTDAPADRSILEALSDPLHHLVKNAIDHGLETPAVRTGAGKGAKGHLHIGFERTSTGLRVTVRDDGRGISREAAARKAVERGLLSRDQARDADDEAIFRLLAVPGFSTAERVTDVSGRGVGLDAVKAGLERVGGSMRIASRPGQGTTITLELPPTLAVTEALEISVEGEPYYVPVDAIVTTIPVSDDDRARGVVDFVDPHRLPAEPPAEEDAEDLTPVPPEPLRLIDLTALLSLPERRHKFVEEDRLEKVERLKARLREHHAEGRHRGRTARAPAPPPVGPLGIVVERHGERACLLVEQTGVIRELVVKHFDLAAARTRHVSGATIRGDGSVGLILDVPSLLFAGPQRPFVVRR